VTLDSEGNIACTQTQYNFFGTNYSLTSPYQADQFTIADWNDDGLDDIVYSTIPGYTEIFFPQQVWVTCSQGSALGNVSFPMVLEVLTSSYSELNAPLTAIGVGIADLTGNGVLDLIATDSGNSQVDIWYRTANSITASPVEFVILAYSVDVYTTFNFGYLYVPETAQLGKSVIVSTELGALDLIINSGGTNFAESRLVSPFVFSPQFASGYIAGSIAVADFNHDGFDDLAVSTTLGVVVFINDPQGDGTASFDLVGQLYQLDTISNILNQDVITGDFNGDGNPDFAVLRNDSSGSIVGFQVFLNDCPACTAPPTSSSSTGCPVSTATFTSTLTVPDTVTKTDVTHITVLSTVTDTHLTHTTILSTATVTGITHTTIMSTATVTGQTHTTTLSTITDIQVTHTTVTSISIVTKFKTVDTTSTVTSTKVQTI
jgi:hypothetical protein